MYISWYVWGYLEFLFVYTALFLKKKTIGSTGMRARVLSQMDICGYLVNKIYLMVKWQDNSTKLSAVCTTTWTDLTQEHVRVTSYQPPNLLGKNVYIFRFLVAYSDGRNRFMCGHGSYRAGTWHATHNMQARLCAGTSLRARTGTNLVL